MPRRVERTRPFPNNIKNIINLHGYKLLEVAQELKVPRSTLSDYMSGNRAVPRELLSNIALLIGCDLSEFHYSREGDPVKGPTSQQNETLSLAAREEGTAEANQVE